MHGSPSKPRKGLLRVEVNGSAGARTPWRTAIFWHRLSARPRRTDEREDGLRRRRMRRVQVLLDGVPVSLPSRSPPCVAKGAASRRWKDW